MKFFFVNLKRFDIPVSLGGVNRLAPIDRWGETIIRQTEPFANSLRTAACCTLLLPEAHLLPALAARSSDSALFIGAQGVHREDVVVGGNFGGFTTLRTAKAVAAMGCSHVIIGHCEERNQIAGVMKEASAMDPAAVNRLLNREILCAQQAGLRVLYCVGEYAHEQERWQQVIGDQLQIGLNDVDLANVVIGYEPVWSIGPGKPVPGVAYIDKVATFIKQFYPVPVIYGGGLKLENAAMVASIQTIDGGLIALTRFAGEIGFYPDECRAIIETYMAIP